LLHRYVSGRTRLPGEINGKSANPNNALCNIIYNNYDDRLGKLALHTARGGGGRECPALVFLVWVDVQVDEFVLISCQGMS
jgi:hypothetical protein